GWQPGDRVSNATVRQQDLEAACLLGWSARPGDGRRERCGRRQAARAGSGGEGDDSGRARVGDRKLRSRTRRDVSAAGRVRCGSFLPDVEISQFLTRGDEEADRAGGSQAGERVERRTQVTRATSFGFGASTRAWLTYNPSDA